MKTLLFVLLLLQINSNAQEIDDPKDGSVGIQWEKGLSWDQIKEKAKKENRYIFVDCYTTWCGPCKRMDEEVYIKDSIGEYMNAKFVNVKVQMDKTKKDDEYVRSWYSDAAELQSKFRVNAFPSYLFFDPQGQIVHRDVAYVEPGKFLRMVAKVFDPKSQYYQLKAEYESGRKNYSMMRFLTRQAFKFNDYQLVKQLNSDYLDYLAKQKKSVIYSKENIDFIASAIPDTKSPWFKIFSREGKRINKLMGQSGFASRAIDSAIAREYINPKLSKLQTAEEPDWDAMYVNIKRGFDENRAARNIVWRKARWYRQKTNKTKYWKYFIECVDIGSMDTSYFMTDIEMNFFAYEMAVVMKPAERAENNMLNKGIKIMQGVVRRSDNIMYLFNEELKEDIALTIRWKSMKIDTYASLLYLAGRKKEAIEWQEQALRIAETNNDLSHAKEFKKALEAMKTDNF